MQQQEQKIETLIPLLSKPRLDNYKPDNNYQEYIDNIDASAVAYPYLHLFEIALRNKINKFVVDNIAANWTIDYLSGENNIKLTQNMESVLYRCFGKLINETFEKENQAYPIINDNRLYIKNHEDIISNLTLGFWVDVLSPSFLKLNGIHFTSIIENVFSLTKVQKGDYTTQVEKINKIRHFRNRIFHFEKILNHKTYNHKNMLSEIKKQINLLDKQGTLFSIISRTNIK